MCKLKKLLLILLPLLLTSACSRCQKNRVSESDLSSSSEIDITKPKREGKVRFRWSDLKDPVVGKVGDFQVQKDIFVEPVLASYLEKRQEVLFALAYRQWLQGTPLSSGREMASESGGETRAVFGLDKPKRSIAAILNQFAIPENKSLKVEFVGQKSSDTLLAWQGANYFQDDLEKNNVLWSGNESDIYRRKIELVEKRLKENALVEASKKEGMSVIEYEKKFIFENQDYDSSERKRRKDFYVEKYLLDLPILTSVKPPNVKFDLKYDWTPSLGAPEADLKVIVMGDFYSEASRNLLASLEGLSKDFPEVYFGFRPVYADSDRYQVMLSDMAFCAWSEEKEKFWQFLPELSKAKKSTLEADAFASMKSLEMNTPNMKACFFERKYKEAVAYHMKYAKYLQVQSFPTVFVGGETFLGAVKPEQIREAIGRSLDIPTAGVWR